ncbi:MAG: TIGR03086 family metal-binding protein [Pseudonocardiales bacterium]|nr:TIGR03086 family metal-binding protein [Pseudonocardiales bacterium]
MDEQTDPRPLYAAALDHVHALMAGAHDPDAPTPCPGFDVRALLGHLVATVERARVIGEGGDPRTVPPVVTGLDDPAAAYAAGAGRALAVWSDDALLDRAVTVPWGTVPGRAAVWGYLNETLVHGWDLAVATGQEPEADPAVAGPALAAAPRTLPARPRGGPVPFGPVVEPRPEAGPTERLANWNGRARP